MNIALDLYHRVGEERATKGHFNVLALKLLHDLHTSVEQILLLSIPVRIRFLNAFQIEEFFLDEGGNGRRRDVIMKQDRLNLPTDLAIGTVWVLVGGKPRDGCISIVGSNNCGHSEGLNKENVTRNRNRIEKSAGLCD